MKHLDSTQDQIVDKLTLKENLGDLFLKLKQFEKAAECYEELIQRNPENTIYYNKLLQAKRHVYILNKLKYLLNDSITTNSIKKN